MPRVINDAGLDLIRRFEGVQLKAYQDVAGIWTIGYGHRHGITEHTPDITQGAADLLLKDDIRSFEDAVETAVASVSTTNNQFAAMVSLCFNIGAINFGASSVLHYHHAGLKQKAANAFLLWDRAHVNSVLTTVRGLARRREAEKALYLTPDKDH